MDYGIRTEPVIKGRHYNVKSPLAVLDATLRIACVEAGMRTPHAIRQRTGMPIISAKRWWKDLRPLSHQQMTILLQFFGLAVVPTPMEKCPKMPYAADQVLDICANEEAE